MPRPKVQLAFQGGGAKLAEMLAIAHAFNDAHDVGLIEIVNVAGTSAGSICATLIAIDADFEAVRNQAANEADGWINKIAGRYKAGISTARHKAFALTETVLGRPLLSAKEFKSTIHALLESGRSRYPNKIEIINSRKGPNLYITTSNISMSSGHIYKEGDLVDAILNSCALPFVFRTHKAIESNPYIDGGLCDNLPVNCLLDMNDEIPVLAISVIDNAVEYRQPNNIVKYLLDLFSASIQHNVNLSKKAVGEGFVFEHESDTSTLDFGRAISLLKNNLEYDQIKKKTEQKISDFYELSGGMFGSGSLLTGARFRQSNFEQSIYTLYKNSIRPKKWIYKRFAMIVRAESLKLAVSEAGKRSDVISGIAYIEAKDESIYGFHSCINKNNETDFVPTAWRAKNHSKNHDMKIDIIPFQDPTNLNPHYGSDCLIIFRDPEDIDLGDEIKIESHNTSRGQLDGLSDTGDYLGFENAHRIEIEEGDIILVYPTSIGQFNVQKYTKRGDYDGVEIPKEELRREYGSALTADYDMVGFRARNIGGGKRFYAWFSKIP